MRPFIDYLDRSLLEKRRYGLPVLPAHLAEIADRERFERVLTDPDFLHAKIEALSPEALIADYALLPSEESVVDERVELWELLEVTLQISSGVLSKDPAQFSSQMTARLLDLSTYFVVAAFLRELENQTTRPRLRSLRRSLYCSEGHDISDSERLGECIWQFGVIRTRKNRAPTTNS